MICGRLNFKLKQERLRAAGAEYAAFSSQLAFFFTFYFYSSYLSEIIMS